MTMAAFIRYCRYVCIICLLTSIQQVEAANLWEGEETRTGAGFPFIAKFIAVEKDAPLVVFIPGGRTLARIAYGGHEGSREEDFLAYWLKERGYNFLGISYPLLTASGAFDEAHPGFSVRAWGRGAAEVTRDVIEENGLTGQVIVAVWSMAGKSVQPYAEAASDLGIDLDFHVSLAATPPLPTDRTMNVKVRMHESGLVDVGQALRVPSGASRAIAANARDNGRDAIIPADVLVDAYLGHQPAQILGSGIRYDKELHGLYRDHWSDIQDTKFYALNYPLVGVLVSGRTDPRHAMTDHATWGYINANTILFNYAGGPAAVRALREDKFRQLKTLAREAQSRLVIDVGGNHFFFVGEKGARATADAIRELQGRIQDLRFELLKLRE